VHSQFLCSFARFHLANRGVRQPIQPHTFYARLLVFDKISAQPHFCSCKLLGRSDECVSLPCFNTQPDIFAVMNCCIVAFLVFSSDMLAWRADRLYSARACARGGWGYPPLKLIFYENFVTWANEINCFRKLFAC